MVTKAEWLERRLPPVIEKELSQELECYGAKKLIARALRFPETLPSTATWEHGWQWEPITHVQQVAGNAESESCRLVTTEAHAEFLRLHGYVNVHAVGIPFIYAPVPNVERKARSLLIMPPHSLAWTNHSWNEREYVRYVASIRDRFSEVVACISGACIDHGYWAAAFEEAGIPWIRGASAADQNGLKRMQIIFRSFEYMSTNSMGSHVAYAAYCGCRVSIAGPYMCPLKEHYKKDPLYNKYPEVLVANLEKNDKANVRRHYPHLFCSPEKAGMHVEWAQHVLGAAFKREDREIARLFGWPENLRQYVRYKARYIVRKPGWPRSVAAVMFRILRTIRGRGTHECG